MRKILFILALMVFFVGCNKEAASEGYTINISGDGYANEQAVYLQKFGDNQQIVVLDTVKFVDGKLQFTGIAENPDVYFIKIDGEQIQFPFMVDNEEINLKLYKDSIYSSELTGEINKGYNEFRKLAKDFQLAMQQLNDAGNKATQAKDSVTYARLGQEFQALREKNKYDEIAFVKSHLNDISGAIILDKHARLKSIPEDEIKELFDQLSDDLKNSSPVKNMAKSFTVTESTRIGAKAPNFVAKDPFGDRVSLKEVVSKGKVTIIDFWASWCKPCRMENPNVVRLYNEYHDKGLEIVGVSLDRAAVKWKQAIDQDQLTWHHASNLLFWNDPIAKQYGVTSIPQTFILDEKGVIIAKNLRGIELENKLKELL